MNNEIVHRWNSVVAPNDEVYHLGDVMLNNNEIGLDLLSKLNGNIHILIGNHDTSNRLTLYSRLPRVDVIGYATILKYNKYHFYLSHYPTYTSNLDNDAPVRQHMLNLYGHTHQTTKFYNDNPFMYCCCMDAHHCYPVLLDNIIEEIKFKVNECRNML